VTENKTTAEIRIVGRAGLSAGSDSTSHVKAALRANGYDPSGITSARFLRMARGVVEIHHVTWNDDGDTGSGTIYVADGKGEY
jgi:hypothetical protein